MLARILRSFIIEDNEIVSKGRLQSPKKAVPDALRWKSVSDIDVVLKKEDLRNSVGISVKCFASESINMLESSFFGLCLFVRFVGSSVSQYP